MATSVEEACKSVIFAETEWYWNYCWPQSEIEPSWNPDAIKTGLRKSFSPGAKAWKSCQYYLKGMPSICSYWQEGACAYNTNNNRDIPTGYNHKKCDYLGRRSTCDKYNAGSAFEPDKYICILPNIFLSGVGIPRSKIGNRTFPTEGLDPVPISEIKGYNDDGTGVGLCDCAGMGRGKAGCDKITSLEGNTTVTLDTDEPITIEGELQKLPVKCNYYRPHIMQFGAASPQEKIYMSDGSLNVEAMKQALIKDGLVPSYRLPFPFQVYNMRAQSQKCLWYERDFGNEFVFHESTGMIALDEEIDVPEDGEIFDSAGVLKYCQCPFSQAAPYKTRTAELQSTLYVDNAPYMGSFLGNVWAVANTVICNGAKPECPCYSGNWLYLKDEKMFSGMPISAQQVLETRFWRTSWSSQKEYDDYYSVKPNHNDPPTSAIFTFGGWKAGTSTSSATSVLFGHKVEMCVPASEFMEDNIRATDVTYGSLLQDRGTTTPTQVTFPNLVRKLETKYASNADKYPFVVTYPYPNDGPFLTGSCFDTSNVNYPNYMTKLTNSLTGDYIHAVGYTVRNRTVYVVNETTAGLMTKYDYTGNRQVPIEKEDEVQMFMHEYIKQVTKYKPESIVSDFTNDFGVFATTRPLKLKYGMNKLFICVDVGDYFLFTVRNVKNVVCGGVVVQNKYERKPVSNYIEVVEPLGISNKGECEARAYPIGSGVLKDCHQVSMRKVINMMSGEEINYYNYSIIKKSQNFTKVDWLPVGSSQYVFGLAGKGVLNYMFPEWKVLSARMIPKIDPETGKTIKKDAVTVEMEAVTGVLDNRYIPYNACVLKPKDPNIRVSFIKRYYDLDIEAEWTEMSYESSPAATEIIHGAGKTPYDIYEAPQAVISFDGDGVITADNVYNRTMGMMADFAAPDDGAVISSFATKLVVMINSVLCRNVRIDYKYSAPGVVYVLEPSSGFQIFVAGSRATGEIRTHFFVTPCGDHLTNGDGEGPMWFPYSACAKEKFYNEWAVGAYCLAKIDGPRDDWRFGGPELYDAWVEVRNAGFRSCDDGYTYFYSTAIGTPEFAGYMNISGIVDVSWYSENGWRLPPFGNMGRDVYESFMSIDYVGHITKLNPPTYRSEWMPMSVDKSMSHFSLNCFNLSNEEEENLNGDSDSDYGFKFTNQFLFMIDNDLGEVIAPDKKRFDDLINVHFEGNCSYPPVTIYIGENSTNTFYTFKDDSVIGAWQEKWKAIERNTPTLLFLNDINYFKYTYSIFKEEKRISPAAGTYTMSYIKKENQPPTIDFGGPTRSFKIFYPSTVDGKVQFSSDEYNFDPVEWLDEGGQQALVPNMDSSIIEPRSSDYNNDYEESGSTQWLFDGKAPGVLFAPGFSGPIDEKSLYTGVDIVGETIKKYYNEALLLDLPKNRLVYLPKKELPTVTLTLPESSAGVRVNTGNITNAYTEPELIMTFEASSFVDAETGKQAVAFSKIYIKGFYGNAEATYVDDNGESAVGMKRIIRPGFEINVRTVDGDEQPLRWMHDTIMKPVVYNGIVAKIIPYEYTLEIDPSPIEMLAKQLSSFDIIIKNAYDGDIMNVEEIQITFVFDYEEKASEPVITHERLYQYSTSSLVNGSDKNLSGTGDLLGYHPDMYNSGQYFKARTFDRSAQTLWLADKTREASVNSAYQQDDVGIDVSYSTLHELEEKSQKDIYNNTVNSSRLATRSYSTRLPQSVVDVMKECGVAMQTSFGNALFKSEPIDFSNLSLTKDFKQYSFWRFGGHYFKWSDYVTRQKCYLFGGPSDVYTGSYMHVQHTGGAQDVMVPYQSYYWLRYEYQFNRYERDYGEGPVAGGDLVSQANVFNAGGVTDSTMGRTVSVDASGKPIY